MNWIEKQIVGIVLKVKGKQVNKIKQAISGKKTYLVAIGSIIAIAISWSAGSMDTMQAIEAIVAAIAVMTIRAGVTKSGVPPTTP